LRPATLGIPANIDRHEWAFVRSCRAPNRSARFCRQRWRTLNDRVVHRSPALVIEHETREDSINLALAHSESPADHPGKLTLISMGEQFPRRLLDRLSQDPARFASQNPPDFSGLRRAASGDCGNLL
jgi:hypothetical protein